MNVKVSTHLRKVGMEPWRERLADIPELWLWPDSRLSVSKEKVPSSGTSRNSPSLHMPAEPSSVWYLISMVTLVCSHNNNDMNTDLEDDQVNQRFRPRVLKDLQQQQSMPICYKFSLLGKPLEMNPLEKTLPAKKKSIPKLPPHNHRNKLFL